MKELTIEQKAQRYDEALTKARNIVNSINVGLIGKDSFEAVFPELAESEDERIMKELIRMVKEDWPGRGDVIAWLEKQGEQEQLYIRFGEIPTDEKSKIYQGEIEVGIENGVSVYPAFKTDEGNIVLGLNLPITKTTLYTQQHLIEYDDRPCYLVKGDYVGKDADGQPLISNVSIVEKIDSYRVKEEKQGEQNLIMAKSPQLGEQKLVEIIPKFNVGDKVYAIKNRFECTIESIDETTYYGDTTNFDIKDQDNWKVVEQNHSWSEEDEQYIIDTLNLLSFGCSIHSVSEVKDFLKSLKYRYTWKPSDEQMKQLGWIAEQNKDNMIGKELMTLYQDLKKLREG